MPLYNNNDLIPVVKTNSSQQSVKTNQNIPIHDVNYSQQQFIPDNDKMKPMFYALYQQTKENNTFTPDEKTYTPNSGIPDYTIGSVIKEIRFQDFYKPWTTLPQRIVKDTKNKILISIKNREQSLVRNLEKIPDKIYDSIMNKVSYEISSVAQKVQDEAKNLAVGLITSAASKIFTKKELTENQKLLEIAKQERKAQKQKYKKELTQSEKKLNEIQAQKKAKKIEDKQLKEKQKQQKQLAQRQQKAKKEWDKQLKKEQWDKKKQQAQLAKRQQKAKEKLAKEQKQTIKTQKMDGVLEQANAPANFQAPETYSVFIGPKNYDNASQQGYDGFGYPLITTALDSQGIEIPYLASKEEVTKNISDGLGTKSVTEISIGSSKEKMKSQQNTILQSIKNFVEKRASSFEKRFLNTPHYDWYFAHKRDPLGLLNQKIIRSQPLSIWKGQDYQMKINDPLSFQAQSYMHDIFTKSSTDEWSKQNINGVQYEHVDGNMINFWIEDVNNGRIMTTPAFLTDVRDEGGKGQWDQSTYVGAQYPKYTYKGAEKRIISFELKIGCFDYQYFPQYLKKLNFLRGVGFPTYTEVTMGTNNYTRSITFPKAPIYKLTLGSIVGDQYGFFQECAFQWPDEQAVWNLPDFKSTKYGIGHALNAQYLQNATGAITSSVEIPIVTTVKCQFVCLYGKGPSNNTQFYGEIPFRDRYQQVSTSQPIPANTDEDTQPSQPLPEEAGGETYQSDQDTNPGEI